MTLLDYPRFTECRIWVFLSAGIRGSSRVGSGDAPSERGFRLAGLGDAGDAERAMGAVDL